MLCTTLMFSLAMSNIGYAMDYTLEHQCYNVGNVGVDALSVEDIDDKQPGDRHTIHLTKDNDFTSAYCSGPSGDDEVNFLKEVDIFINHQGNIVVKFTTANNELEDSDEDSTGEAANILSSENYIICDNDAESKICYRKGKPGTVTFMGDYFVEKDNSEKPFVMKGEGEICITFDSKTAGEYLTNFEMLNIIQDKPKLWNPFREKELFMCTKKGTWGSWGRRDKRIIQIRKNSHTDTKSVYSISKCKKSLDKFRPKKLKEFNNEKYGSWYQLYSNMIKKGGAKGYSFLPSEYALFFKEGEDTFDQIGVLRKDITEETRHVETLQEIGKRLIQAMEIADMSCRMSS